MNFLRTALVAVLAVPSRVVAQQASALILPIPAPAWATAAAPLVFEGVTVVDVAQGKLVPDQRVTVVGSHITAVAPRRGAPPAGARLVDAKGKYLIPGLWDMHAHVDQDAGLRYPGFIAYGVTGLREMAQRFPHGADSFRVWQREIMAGTRVGPRVVGPSYDICFPDGRVSSGPSLERGIQLVDSLKQMAGMAFLKLHGCMSKPDVFFATMREARRIGLPVVGHLPDGVSEIEASDSGMQSLEHLQLYPTCWPNDPVPPDTLLAQRCAPVAAALIRNGTWIVPTLTVHYHFVGNLNDAQDFVRVMHRFGVRMLAGTDFTAEDLTHGLSLHEELGFLVGAGLTPLEALRAATLSPAQFFEATDSLGTVAAGKLADLVLLDANPLADIHNTLAIHAVVANGRYFDTTALAALRKVATPAAVQQLLATGGHTVNREWTYRDAIDRERDPDLGDTGAVYFGYRRTTGFTSPEGLRHDTAATYTMPAPLTAPKAWGLAGSWRVTSEGATLVAPPGRLMLRFHARYVNLVCDNTNHWVQLRALLDGQEPGDDHGRGVKPNGEPHSGNPRWPGKMFCGVLTHSIVHQHGPLRDRTLEIEFLEPVTIYETTFDPTIGD